MITSELTQRKEDGDMNTDMIYNCTTCQRECTSAGWSSELPCVARNADGEPFCQFCAADMDRASIAKGEPIGAYLSSDGTTLTTWAGEVLAKVTQIGEGRSGFHGSVVASWRARTPEGVRLYGRCGGRGMYTNVRYAR